MVTFGGGRPDGREGSRDGEDEWSALVPLT